IPRRKKRFMSENVNRREFVKGAVALGAARNLMARGAKATSTARAIGPNDKIQLGIIGVGGRGAYLARQFTMHGEQHGSCKIVALADVWAKRKNQHAKTYNCDGYLDYREIINRKDVDAIVVATPDHWHAQIALEGMDRGKDVYLEKPMCHTIEEAKQLAATVRETKRVLQVGSQTTSAEQWHLAKKYIADGAI